MVKKKRVSLVHEQHFAHATRDTGYKSTAAAVSELVDNSVQAGAANIHVLVRQTGVGGKRAITVAVWDDGSGMSGPVLQQALQFGGSTRFNDRSGLGRFGMGLPNSSLSQARRVEVFTWRSARRVLSSYLDLDEIASGDLDAIPTPTAKTLPPWAPAPCGKGTLVVWTKCDRLDYRKASTIERTLRRELGRVFRHLLWGGVTITINEKQVVGIDPLFCHCDAEMSGAEFYLEPLTYDVRVPGNPRRTAPVIVRFSRLPIEVWHSLSSQEKRRAGIVGGAGASIIRGGREIARGWYFMGAKRRQNYDDWWRCEVSFEPALDEHFGVPHSKQGIRPTSEITQIIAADVEPVAHQLSADVRVAFAALKRPPKATAANLATDRDWRLPRLPVAGSHSQEGSERTVTHLRYRVDVADRTTPRFMEWEVEGHQMLLTLNRSHPFFREVYERARRSDSSWIRHDLECMLLAFARATEMARDDKAGDLLSVWSDVLATYLGE